MDGKPGTSSSDGQQRSALSINNNYGNLVYIANNIVGGSMNNKIIISSKEVQRNELDVVGIKCGVPEVLEEIIGRDDVMDELKRRVLSDKFVTIVGMAGIGKTLTALSCVHAWVPGTFETAVLIHMDSAETVKESLTSFLNYVELSPNSNNLENVKTVYNLFRNNKCLLIFDNIEKKNSHLNFMWTEAKGRNVFILGTSQFAEIKNSFRLEKLSEERASQLLKEELKDCPNELVPDTSEDILELAIMLDRHPLAIKMAAAWIKDIREFETKSYSISDYIKEYQSRFNDEKPFNSNINYDKTVYTAIVLNIDKIKSNNCDGYKLLSILTFLNPAFITRWDLNGFDFTDVTKAIRILKQHSIIQYQDTGNDFDNIVIHRLFQMINHELLKNDAQCDTYKSILFKKCVSNNFLQYMHLRHILKYFETEEEITENYKITDGDSKKTYGNERLYIEDDKSDKVNWKACHYAIYHGHRDVIERLVEFDAPLSEVTAKGWSVVHSLISITEFQENNLFLFNNIKSLKKIPEDSVKSAISLFFDNIDSYSLKQLLFVAEVFLLLSNDEELTKTVIKYKGKLEVLLLVIRFKFDNIFELLFDSKIDLNTHLGMEKRTLLTFALERNNMKASKRLIDLGVDINRRDASGESPLFAAIRNIVYSKDKSDLNIEAIKYLVTRSENTILRNPSSDETNILHEAVISGDVNIVKLVIQVLQERNLLDEFSKQKDERCKNPIHEAVKRGNIDIIQLVTSEYFDLLTNNGENLFHIAASSGRSSVVSCLAEILENNGKPLKDFLETRDIEGRTPLLAAVNNQIKNLEVVKVLIDLDADRNAVDVRGNTIFHVAVRSQNSNILKYLVDVETSTGDPNNSSVKQFLDRKNNRGQTPLHLAAMYCSSLEIAKLLIEHYKLDRKVADRKGNTVLHLAVRYGDVNTVKYLIELDISEHSYIDKSSLLYQRNNRGRTPLHLAAENYFRLEIVKLLIEDYKLDRRVVDREGNTIQTLLQAGLGNFVNIVKYFGNENK